MKKKKKKIPENILPVNANGCQVEDRRRTRHNICRHPSITQLVTKCPFFYNLWAKENICYQVRGKHIEWRLKLL